MESIQTLDLIAGTFTPNEAEEILLEMIKSKINFHNLKNFTSMVKYDEPDYLSKQRIKELSELREEVIHFTREARESNRNLKIYSEICIQFED
ncbi:MAG: hypothetical protein IPP60_14195 [Sphingobacteriales bacterium]|nr:hypothetical protein [Sphingobacteriales bacterium]MBK9794206.1 hypothetical protein [Sphingobacteriales bacterium]MBP8192702.1 hypothetical protein [Chitinophagales bacterium]HNY54644.1 hypothetical protein [Chitinophagales bacterium]